MDRSEDLIAVLLEQHRVPVVRIAGAAETIDRNSGNLGATSTPGGDTRDGELHVGHSVGGPSAGFGHDEGSIGGEESVDGQEPERRRAVDHDEVVSMALERQLQTILRSDRIVGELRLPGGERRAAGEDIRCWTTGERPRGGQSEGTCRTGTIGFECGIDRDGGLPDTQSGRGIGLRVEVDHQHAPAPLGSSRSEAQGHSGLTHSALLVHHSDDRHEPTLRGRIRPSGDTERGNASLVGITGIAAVLSGDMTITAGQTVPEFSLPDQDGTTVTSAQLRGGWAVVYFYPKDDTPGCTAESCSFRDNFEAFSDVGAKVIGISSDSVESHKAFAQKHNLPFTLLADTDGTVRKQFGVGRTLGLLPGRVTYVIDPEGIVQKVFSSQFKPKKHIDEALTTITGS